MKKEGVEWRKSRENEIPSCKKVVSLASLTRTPRVRVRLARETSKKAGHVANNPQI